MTLSRLPSVLSVLATLVALPLHHAGADAPQSKSTVNSTAKMDDDPSGATNADAAAPDE